MIHSKVLLAALLLSIVTLSGCSNTFDGAGRDIKGMGSWVEDTF